MIQGSLMKGFLLALSACCLISTNYITGKIGVSGFGSNAFSLIWVSAATCYALIGILWAGRQKELILPREVWIQVLALGVFTALQMIFFWWSLTLLNASLAAFLGRFEPALTILLAGLFLGEQLRPREVVAFGVMLFGACLSTVGRWEVVELGVVLVLLACLSMSLQFILGKNLVGKVHPSVLVFYRVAVASGILAIWVFVLGEARFDAAPIFWILTLLGAFLGPCAGYTLLFHSYRFWDLTRSASVMILQPLFVMPLGLLFFPEQQLTLLQLMGGLSILAGALWLLSTHRISSA